MITGPHDVLPVRLTATTSGNASRRRVRRISVGTLVICSAGWAISVGAAADAKKDSGSIRIIPATKTHSTLPPSPRMNQMNRGPALKPPAKPAGELPPLPAEPTPAKERHQPAKEGHQAGQLRIIPARRSASAPNAERFEQIYRSIPYSRSAYELDPMYRQEIALSLLFNRFPPAPVMMPPGPSGMGMGPRGPMSPNRSAPSFGNRAYEEPPMLPPGVVPEF